MATTVVEAVFLDTNILLYASQLHSPFHAAATNELRKLASAGHPLWLSRQVLREYLAAMSRPNTLTAPVPMSTLVADVRAFEQQFIVAEDSLAVTAQLLNLLASVSCAGKQIHDANIVATMLAYQVPILLTHNTADFARFSGYIQLLPLVP